MIDTDHEYRFKRAEPDAAGRSELVRLLKSDLVRHERFIPADNPYPHRGRIRLARCDL